MTSIEHLRAKLKALLPALAQRYHVASLALFGSYVRGDQDGGSDLDVLVTFSKTPGLLKFVELENTLSDELGVKVDLVMPDALKPGIGKRVLSEAVPVLLSLLLGLLPLLTASCSRTKPITNGAWSFDEKNGALMCNGIAVPARLAKHQLWLFTPLGTFGPRAGGTWFFRGFKIPLPDPTKPWVQVRINSTSSRFMQEHTRAGFYATHTLGWGPSSWLDCQLTDTPSSWIYAFRVRDGKESGAWIAPEKLGEVNWAEILENTETAQLDLK